MVYLTLTAMFMLVLWPALLPAAIHGSHAIVGSRRKAARFAAGGRQLMLANRQTA